MGNETYFEEEMKYLSHINLKLYLPHRRLKLSGSSSELTVIALFVIFCALFNTLCIYAICQRRRLRSIDYLLGNLAFSIIFVCFILTALFTNLLRFLPLSPQGKCSVSNYLKYLTGSTISLASFAISFERLSSLDKVQTRKRRLTLSTGKIVGVVWISSTMIILPTTLTSVTTPDILLNITNISSPCWRVPLFYSKFMDIWYEMSKFLFLHLAFCVCVFSELYMVRSKIKYLWMRQQVRETKLKSKINRVRWAFIQSIIFIILWSCVGVSNVVYAIYRWYSPKNLKVIKTSLGLMRGIGYLYMIVNPIAVFFSNQDSSIWKKVYKNLLHFCGMKKTRDSENIESTDGDQDVSRFATRMSESVIPTVSVQPSNEEDQTL